MTDIALISLAQAELAKMANFARAFADAQTVINALANADQVARECAARADEARAALAEAEVAAAQVEAEAAVLLDAAAAALDQARVDAKTIVENAHADVAGHIAHGEKVASRSAEAASRLDALDSREIAVAEREAAAEQFGAELAALKDDLDRRLAVIRAAAA